MVVRNRSKDLLFIVTTILAFVVSSIHGKEVSSGAVTYDARSLIIGGTRELIFSGSIHYPRSTPEMWPDLIRKAKEGGCNAIQTYVFWNIHEPVQGQYNFEGRADLVKFIKLIAENDMYAILRVGPFIQAEWNLGGLPYWLKEVPGITFRSYNEPFMHHMKKYVEMIINMMKNEKLFAPQGGPIILAQIENEYNHVQLSYREKGIQYIKWAADMAVGLYPDIPWIMCKQIDAPQNVINTCNGRHCADTFSGPNSPNKPTLWTENWTAQYRVFGDPPSQRAAEDIAYAVARFFMKNGSMTNYYMYHGGTNFGRTSSSFVATRYYDEAPLDEFGLQRQPKWGHLRDLHRTLRLAKKAFLWGTPKVQDLTKHLQVVTFEKQGTPLCAAFLSNTHKKNNGTINFRGKVYDIRRRTVIILPDCKTVVYNSDVILSQHSSRKFHPSKKAGKLNWEMYREPVPEMKNLPLKNKAPFELSSHTKDTTDYMWYSTSLNIDGDDLPMRSDILPVIQVQSLGDALLAFINGEYIGFGHGRFENRQFTFSKPISFRPGLNHISFLAMTVGLPNSGAYMEKRFSGVRAVILQGMSTGSLDITLNQWGHKIGIEGEKLELFTEEGASKVTWTPASGQGLPITWYKTYFNAPEGKSPVAIKMEKMGKGMIWVNGNSLGRYWTNFRSALGSPTQSEYHVPREWIKPTNNLLVVFEESGGNVEGVEIVTVNRDEICSYIREDAPASLDTWIKEGDSLRANEENPRATAVLSCDRGKIISEVRFASFGDPFGACGNYLHGKCQSPNAKKVVEQACVGKNSCRVPVDRASLDGGNDTCAGLNIKTLAIQARCGRSKKGE